MYYKLTHTGAQIDKGVKSAFPKMQYLEDVFASFPAKFEDVIHAGVETFSGDGSLTGERTFISTDLSQRVRQPGEITSVDIMLFSVYTLGTLPAWVNNIKIKVFQIDGGSYTMVGESSITPTEVNSYTLTATLGSPITAECGDIVGMLLPVGGQVQIKTGGTTLKEEGDVTGTAEFSTSYAYSLNITVYGLPPFLTITGDSIAEGHNEGTWHSYPYGGGPQGDINAEPAHHLRGIFDELLSYQNHAYGGQTFAWVASTGIASAAATNARAIIVHCGVNDVAQARTWVDIEADLDTIAAAINPNRQHLFVDEILPWLAGDNTEAATIRTYNRNLKTWCNANGATLIECWAEMGQVRAATGDLDNILSAYNNDGVHLKQVGVAHLARLWAAALEKHFTGRSE